MALQPSPWPDAGTFDSDDGSASRTVQRMVRDHGAAAANEVEGDEFDDLVCMASRVLDGPIAMLAIAEGGQFRVAAKRGLASTPELRGHTLWRAVGQTRPLLLLPDAAADVRFRDDPAVACAGGVRFYLGIALFGSNGMLLGVLSVADRRPRSAVPDDALLMLRRVARLATRLIERRQFERSNRIAEQIAQTGFSAVVVVDGAGTVTFANVAAQALFGPAVTSGRPVHALFPAALQADPDAVANWLRPGAGDAPDDSTAACELQVQCGDGEPRLLEAVRCAWPAGDGNGMALILRDITDNQRLQRVRLGEQQDALTGLPNRAALLSAIDALHQQATPLSVALLGLDNFRSVNDTLGHAIGDAVLQVVACRLLARLPAGAHLARFGGDEFALVFPSTAPGAIEAQLHAMLREIARPCEVDHHRVHIAAHVGLAATGGTPGLAEEIAGASELIARAGLAMQHAKRSSGRRLRRFEPGMRAEAIDRRKLELELHRACREGEFELHYQPQMDLASARPTGAEALLRWRHPERGLLLPAAFIDALAHSAVAPAVGRWILQRACRDAAAWPPVDGRRLAVGVNLFPAQFEGEQFLDEVDQALAMSGLAPAQLELELTETIALRDDGVAEQTLMQLRARGIRIAFDDFGTGYASLSMLHRLPVDRVKIDRSFVCDVIANRGDEAIVRSIALIARNFDLQVIAEGVETPVQAELLRQIGCQEVQGFLYSMALAPADFDGWLAGHANPVPAAGANAPAQAVRHG
ncbi:putative bifunctional diguanylate cyclase/phosphodiesterase [Lysobacter koreensis]|uniref:Bifunctional diguanylate cyclase/phosphodiesterase n=1 Tax=Lysobacter koreensis TaxID=266122 RepID=A0ABW2YM68_9GAMM